MKLNRFIKDKLLVLFIFYIIIVLIFLILKIFNVPIYLNITIIFLLLIESITILLIEYMRKRKFYSSLNNNLKKLDKKYLVLETIDKPNTYEQELLNDYLYEINKSMIENINKQKNDIEDFKEFVEMWIHEVKIPISSLVLKCHNNKDKLSDEFLSIIRKLDNNIDQILYYVRSNYTEKDFVITSYKLKEIVRNVTIKNKDDLLCNNIKLEVDVNDVIKTDKKWLEFIINQIINNSIKYKKKKNSIIKIYSENKKDRIILCIYDNGIGISKTDIKRVFDKSFTGINGRNKIKSTGMGLYIVKNLCEKLGHKIYIESIENEYTKVYIEFGINDMYF